MIKSMNIVTNSAIRCNNRLETFNFNIARTTSLLKTATWGGALPEGYLGLWSYL